MSRIFPGRYTARSEQPLVLFAIGMRINRAFAIHRWLLPTINTIRLWRHMQWQRPDGYLGGYLYVYWRGVGMTQYWRDFESLIAFSHDKTQPHVAAWQQLAKLTQKDQSFGYWHETYTVAPGTSEAIYGSMPRFGLAAATDHAPIGRNTESAQARLRDTPSA